MWLFTPIGFFSVVADRNRPDQLIIRARVHEDLQALRDRYLPELLLVDQAGTDYAWRAWVARDRWETAAAAMAAAIDYPNFKNAVQERQGSGRAHAYMEIWQVMYGVQQEAPPGLGR